MVTKDQVSAGGVVWQAKAPKVVLVSVGEKGRWQLPKGLVERGEAPEAAAGREVREETGVEAELVAPIDTIDYWYVAKSRGATVRFHKLVHFFLFAYLSGDVADHDHEVNEARWFSLAEARDALAFANERRVLERAGEMIGALEP